MAKQITTMIPMMAEEAAVTKFVSSREKQKEYVLE